MIDLNKPLETRNGHKVRIYDECGTYDGLKIFGSIDLGGDNWSLFQWLEDGYYIGCGRDHELDLVNVKEKHVGWINIVSTKNFSTTGNVYQTEGDALRVAPADTVATVKIEWEQ